MFLGMEGCSYMGRLHKLGLLALGHKRLRRDLVEVYEIEGHRIYIQNPPPGQEHLELDGTGFG